MRTLPLSALPLFGIALIALAGESRPGGAWLRLEDRRLGAALRPGRAGVLPARLRPPLPPRRLAARPRREPHRGQLPDRAAGVARPVRSEGRHRAAPLRALL